MSHLTLTDEQYQAYLNRQRNNLAKQMERAKKRLLASDPHLQAGRALEGVRKPSKYRSHKTGGYASKKEATRAQQLRLMLAAGEIFDLREQVKYELIPAQRDAAGKLLERACSYVADFVYEDKAGNMIVEDVKGQKSGPAYALFVLKRKLMLHMHKIRITEI